MKRPRPRRRMLIIVIGLLALLGGGAVVNVMQAWVVAILHQYINNQHMVIPTGWTIGSGVARDPTAVWRRFHHESRDFGFFAGCSVFEQFEPRGANRATVTLWRYSAGWPCLAVQGDMQTFITGQVRSIRPSMTVGSGFPWLVPMEVRPIGFLINTIFYAAVCWAVLVVPVSLRRIMRRRLRLRRNLCPMCAYPIGSSDVCTECGASVTKSVA